MATVIAAFRAARIAGGDAQECMSASAALEYARRQGDDEALLASPGPLCLYGCGHYRVADVVSIPGQTSDDADGTTTVGLEIRLRNTGGATQTSFQGPTSEYVTIGPAKDLEGVLRSKLITGVSNT